MRNKVKSKTKKVIVLGFDGASWTIFKPLAEAGFMPNLARLMREGAWGNLESSFPVVTASAWVTMATGKNPGQHGCYAFMMPEKTITNTFPINRENIHGSTFYELLDKQNKNSIIINLPCSFPPRTKNAILLPSFITLSKQKIYPEKITKLLPELSDYRVVPPPRTWWENSNALIAGAAEIEANRFKVAKALFTRFNWDFFFLMFSSTDWIQHRRIDDLFDVNKKSLVKKIYQEFDKYIGWFMDNLPKDTLLLIVSDHGFGKADYYFHVNAWLEKRGLLKQKRIITNSKEHLPYAIQQMLAYDAKSLVDKIFKFTVEGLLRLPWLYALAGDIARVIFGLLPKSWNFLPRGIWNIGLQVDNQKTYAFTPIGVLDSIYINSRNRFDRGIASEVERIQIQEEIVNALKRLKDPDGKPVFYSVLKRNEAFKGSAFSKAPDIVFGSDHVVISGELGHKEIFERSNKGQGCHQRNGIFLAWGNGVNKKGRVHNADISDIAPTILNILGSNIPPDIEGRTLPGIITNQHDELTKKIRRSKDLIANILHKYPYKNLRLAWTGGKDSTVLLWLVKEVCSELKMPMVKVVCIDEGDMFDEVKEFISRICKSWKLDMEYIKNTDVLKQVKSLGDLVYARKLNKDNREALKTLNYKMDKFIFEPESMVGNHLMKTVPFLSYIRDHNIQAVMVGIRRDEHAARSKETEISRRSNPFHMRIHPILDFTESDIWDTIRLYSLPYNKLYEQGYRSLGVKSTTKKTSEIPAWRQDTKIANERQGRRQDKEGLMERLRRIGYM